MKQLLIALTAMVFIAACNNDKDNKDAKVAGTSDTKDNNAAVNTQHMKDVYEAIQTGDMSKVSSYFADDCVDHNAGNNNGDIKGKDTIIKMISEIHNYFEPGFKVEYMGDATSADGTTQYAMSHMTGKTKANPWGMPVGQDFDHTSVDVVKIKDGKATDHWEFMSNKDMNEMMMGMQKMQDAKAKK